MEDLFGNIFSVEQTSKVKYDDYDAFCEKFKPKKTTDDCYTPPEVYDVILAHIRERCDLQGKRILRPFKPGGDYQAIEYLPNDVVIDNPPFSIFTQIVRYYVNRGIRFFLFGPSLTLFCASKDLNVTKVAAGCNIVYENGAAVNTSFVTNLYGDGAIIIDGELNSKLRKAQKAQKAAKATKTVRKIAYPANFITAAMCSNIAKSGRVLTIPRTDTEFTTKLSNYPVYGGGYLISDDAAERLAAERLAAERLAAERLAAERLAAERLAEKIPLTDREKSIIQKLNLHTKKQTEK